jgi:hypothetical protein
MDLKKIRHEPRCQGVASGALKMIFDPMIRLVQTVHLSCTATNTISKRTESRFHMTHVICEFHRVGPKLFLSLWSIGTNHVPILRQD